MGVYADSDARRDAHILVPDLVQVAECSPNFVGTDLRILCACDLREQNNELISTLAADRVRSPHGSDEASRYRFQKLIADRMTQRVVDVLEMINVHEQQCQ